MNLNAEPNPVTLTPELLKKDHHLKTHGDSRDSRLYRIWRSMIRRCHNINSDNYKYYGGRGISTCHEWRVSYQVFKRWSMVNGYSNDLSIDRIDTNGNYEPSNCKWSTRGVQMNNTRRNRKMTIDGVTMNVREASIKYGIIEGTLLHRLNLGWSDDDAVKIKPVKGRNQSWKR